MCLDNLKPTFNTMIIHGYRHLDHLNSSILMPRVPNKPQKDFQRQVQVKASALPPGLWEDGPWLSAWLCLIVFGGNPLWHPIANRHFPMTYAIWEVYRIPLGKW